MKVPTIEIRSAKPLEIPQVAMVFGITQQWLDLINEHKVNVVYLIERSLSGGFGTQSNVMRDDFMPQYSRMEKKQINKVKRIETGDCECLQVSLTIKKNIWDLLELAASNVSRSPLRVLLTIIGDKLSWEIGEGKKVSDIMAKIASDAALKRTQDPVPQGKVLVGAWKSNPKKRRQRADMANMAEAENICLGPWEQIA